MSMRVSTAQLYSSGTSGIQKLQSNLYTLQNQVDTGRRIVTPKDDPVGAAQALVVTQSASVNELYLKNQSAADSKLSVLDSTLGSINTELQNIYEKAVAAGNGSYSDSDRAVVATELAGRLDSLLSMANTRDGTGRYVFAGFQSTVRPFVLSGNSTPYSLANTYVTYQGDDGVQILQVSSSTKIATNVPGSDVFMRVKDANGNLTQRSVFDAVQNMVDFLNTPGASASSASYTQALSDLDAAMDNVLRAQTSAGAREASLENMTNMAEDRKFQYAEQLSNLEDLDYAKAISDVAQKKIQMEAAQATFAATAKLSLFDYI